MQECAGLAALDLLLGGGEELPSPPPKPVPHPLSSQTAGLGW